MSDLQLAMAESSNQETQPQLLHPVMDARTYVQSISNCAVSSQVKGLKQANAYFYSSSIEGHHQVAAVLAQDPDLFQRMGEDLQNPAYRHLKKIELIHRIYELRYFVENASSDNIERLVDELSQVSARSCIYMKATSGYIDPNVYKAAMQKIESHPFYYTNARAHLIVAMAYFKASIQKIKEISDSQRLNLAIKHFKIAAEAGEKTAHQYLGKIYRGDKLIQFKDLDQAAFHYEKSIEERSQPFTTVRRKLASIYYEQKEFDKAILHYHVLAENHEDVSLRLGECYEFGRQDYENAMVIYGRLSENLAEGLILRCRLKESCANTSLQAKAVQDYCDYIFTRAEQNKDLPIDEVQDIARIAENLEPVYRLKLNFILDLTQGDDFINTELESGYTPRVRLCEIMEALVKIDLYFIDEDYKFQNITAILQRDMTLAHELREFTAYKEDFKIAYFSYLKSQKNVKAALIRHVAIKILENIKDPRKALIAAMAHLEAKFSKALVELYHEKQLFVPFYAYFQTDEGIRAFMERVYETCEAEINKVHKMIPAEFRSVGNGPLDNPIEKASNLFCRWRQSILRMKRSYSKIGQAQHSAASSENRKRLPSADCAEGVQGALKRSRLDEQGATAAGAVAAAASDLAFIHDAEPQLPLFQLDIHKAVLLLLGEVDQGFQSDALLVETAFEDEDIGFSDARSASTVTARAIAIAGDDFVEAADNDAAPPATPELSSSAYNSLSGLISGEKSEDSVPVQSAPVRRRGPRFKNINADSLAKLRASSLVGQRVRRAPAAAVVPKRAVRRSPAVAMAAPKVAVFQPPMRAAARAAEAAIRETADEDCTVDGSEDLPVDLT